MREQYLVFLTIFISTIFLLYGVSSLSIRYEEAVILFEGTSLVHYLVHYSTSIFGQNDLALRLPFILLHVASLILLYKIGKLFLKRKLDRVISIALYAMLPGVNSAAILVNGAYIKSGPTDGKFVYYDKRNLAKRWTVQGKNDGWYVEIR